MKLSNSGFTCFLKCPKKYEYEHVMRRRPADENINFVMGTAVHTGLEGFWTGKGLQESIDMALATLSPDAVIMAEQTKAMLTGYFNNWSTDDWDLISVEEEVVTDIEGITHVMRVDGLARSKKDGKLYLIEHKTTSSDIASRDKETGEYVGDHKLDYWARLRMNSQIASYKWALENKYQEEVGILYDVIKKPTSKEPLKSKAKQKKTETDLEYATRCAAGHESVGDYGERIKQIYLDTPERWYGRMVINMTSRDINMWKQEYMLTAETIRKYNDAGCFPRSSGACGYGAMKCEYIDVCCGRKHIGCTDFMDAEDRYQVEDKNKLPF